VEEGGGVRGCEVSRRSVRGHQAAVCVHVHTQSGCFGGDEADFALRTRAECRAAEAELVLVRLRWRTHKGFTYATMRLFFAMLPNAFEKDKKRPWQQIKMRAS
jgi:hypothetical protein